MKQKSCPVLLASTVLFFSACISEPAADTNIGKNRIIEAIATPEQVAINFAKSMNNLDFNKARSLSDSTTAQLINMLQGMASMSEKPIKSEGNIEEIKTAKCNINGEKAICLVCCIDGNEEEVELVKIKGKWLVHFSKEDSMNEENS